MRLKPAFACYFLILLCSVPRQAQCQAVDGVYRGTLGKQEIVLEIGAEPEHVDPKNKGGQNLVGRYFYRRYGIDISIKGTRTKDGSFLLTEDTADATAHIQWRLKFQDNVASGGFCKCDLQNAPATKLVPIYLKRVFPANFEDSIRGDTAERSHQVYDDLLLDFPLTAGPEVATKSGYAYSMMTDPRFKTSMPRITKFPDAGAITKINSLLQQELAKFRLEASQCFWASRVSEFDISTSVVLFSRHLLTLTRDGAYYCGGAHPDEYFLTNTYDLDSGKEVSTESLLAREMDPAAVKKAIKDGDAAGEDAISRLAKLLYLHHSSPEEECQGVIDRDDTSGDPGFRTTQYLSESGLVIMLDLPHVAATCADEVVIPYGELRPLLKKDSQFLTLVETAH